jgi:alkyl hydroperoxide reductase subunit AhpC
MIVMIFFFAGLDFVFECTSDLGKFLNQVWI